MEVIFVLDRLGSSLLLLLLLLPDELLLEYFDFVDDDEEDDDEEEFCGIDVDSLSCVLFVLFVLLLCLSLSLELFEDELVLVEEPEAKPLDDDEAEVDDG